MLLPAKSPSMEPGKWLLLLLLLSSALSIRATSQLHLRKKTHMKQKVQKMFYHAYNNYMAHAFPHDELKPLTKTFTDSLSELGNLKLEHLPNNYNGSALTLIESLSSLVIMGNNTEFERAVLWLSENLSFDVDARINLFEGNIRVLGGLVSAHILATDSRHRLAPEVYKDQLLHLAADLGQRFLHAFHTPTGLPYAWVNLKYGVMENETTETSTSGCGSLILEMGVLSRLTGDSRYETAALRALRMLWSMRSPLNLLGTTLDVVTGEWIEYSSGIGAGVDSFYEYLMKAHILFGGEEYWGMFHPAYLAVQKYFRHGPWYHDSDMRTGRATYWQLTSLQAFWPGLQVLVGDVAAANLSHREFFNVWEKFGVLPERYLLDREMLHPTEKYYPLRPEFAESTFYLYQATKDPWYLQVGEAIVNSLNRYTKVEGGFASIKDVATMKLEDHQHSFFLSETCKYLYLLFDDSFVVDQNYIFTTEGHPLPVKRAWHERLPESYIRTNWTSVMGPKQTCGQHILKEWLEHYTVIKSEPGYKSFKQSNPMITFCIGTRRLARPLKISATLLCCPILWLMTKAASYGTRRASAMSLQVCPSITPTPQGTGNYQVESACHIPDLRSDHRCMTDDDCGTDSNSCRRRTCSMAGYCGLWLLTV